jgi:hypothetical protein
MQPNPFDVRVLLALLLLAVSLGWIHTLRQKRALEVAVTILEFSPCASEMSL